MVTKRAHSSPAAKVTGADDFALIQGIGPAVKSRLHDARVLSFAQLGALSPEEILATIGKIPGMSAERIARQNWVGQARKLSTAVSPPNYSDEKLPQDHQRYATYKVELLIDETGSLRRTHIVHVQSSEEASWAAWDQARFVEFIVTHAELSTPCAEEIRATFIAPPVRHVRVPASAEATPVDDKKLSQYRLRELVVVPKDSATPRMVVARDQPFSIRLTLNIGDLVTPAQTWLNYETTVRAKSLDGGARQVVGHSRETLLSADTITINMEGKSLPAGTYRLEAVVALVPPSIEWPSPIMLSGGVLQVY